MADINEMGVTGNYEGTVIGGIGSDATYQANEDITSAVSGNEFKPVQNALPVKTGFWSKVKAFLFQEIDWNKEIRVELTPYQQKVEDEINEFLHQEITWTKVKSFLFKEIKF